MNLNFAPPMEMEDTKEKEPFNFALNHHINVSSSSSSSASCRVFFNPTQDHMEFYHPQLYHHPQDECYGYNHRGSSSSSYEMENKVENGLKKLRVWKREDEKLAAAQKWINNNNNNSSKQLDHVAKNINEVKKVMPSSYSSVETDLSSSYTPIRVCSDCHTTKTPLWRSGPKGPKSLCNACGIRQRKARRAMAAAGGAPPPAKEKMGKNGQVKKRCKVAAGGGGAGGKKTGGFEDFLVNLSNKLAIHRVFPQDEKEAAILLMALSSGLVHG